MYRDAEFAVIDLETTGFSPQKHDRIIEVGIVRTDPQGKTLKEYCTLINPQRDIGDTQIHGITATDVIGAPVFQEVVGDIHTFLRGAILVAHNAQFDLRFLTYECNRSGAPLPEILSLCTLSLAKIVAPELPSRRLGVLCEHFGIPLDNAHTALGDARATASLLATLLSSIGTPTRRISWEELGAKIVHSDTCSWPKVAPSGKEYRRESVQAFSKQNRPRLVRLFSQLPPHNDTNNCADEYLAVLERALEDRKITEDEVDALKDVAHSLDMDAQEVREAHSRFLNDMVQAAWADKVITDAERREIESVAYLLGFSERDYHRMIDDVQENPLSENTIPHPCIEALEGITVCFTGTSNAIIGGEVMNREKLEKLATGKGMIVKKSVTKSLDLLICADPNSMSSKARKARQYGTRIVAESAFFRKLGII